MGDRGRQRCPGELSRNAGILRSARMQRKQIYWLSWAERFHVALQRLVAR